MKENNTDAASFRDPSGFVFTRNSNIYRQINLGYKEHYDHLIESGLYRSLVESGWLIPHEEVDIDLALSSSAYKIIKPRKIDFISYPYEWCFSQLKDAALTTLLLQRTALDFGMTLKDASAYNIQFDEGSPILIDTISFEKYREGYPWVAYRQFCQHFLAPLALMAYTDIKLNQLFRTNIDGIPLDLTSRLLPFRTRFRFSILMHLHIHARTQKRYATKNTDIRKPRLTHSALINIVNSLQSAIEKLSWRPEGTEWADYYSDYNYSPESFQLKKQIISDFLSIVEPKTVWDLGANIGEFSRLVKKADARIISFDIDPAAVEINYQHARENSEKNILPLLLDLTNPSPSIGWGHEERLSLAQRGPVDMVMALALIHHLAISNNLPLPLIASFFSTIAGWLIIEFVPKSDSQVGRLLKSREDIFANYNISAFEESFSRYFTIQSSKEIAGSERTLYLMKKRSDI